MDTQSTTPAGTVAATDAETKPQAHRADGAADPSFAAGIADEGSIPDTLPDGAKPAPAD